MGGCGTSKSSRKSSRMDNNSIGTKPKTSTNQESGQFPSFSQLPQVAKPGNEIPMHNLLPKKAGLHVDYINNPLQIDQITAKITRHPQISFYSKKQEQDYYYESTKNRPTIERKKGSQSKHVGTVQEKSEFEESGTTRVDSKIKIAFQKTESTGQSSVQKGISIES